MAVQATVRFANSEADAATVILGMQAGETILVVSGHGRDASRVRRDERGWEVTALECVTVANADGSVTIPLVELADGLRIILHEPGD